MVSNLIVQRTQEVVSLVSSMANIRASFPFSSVFNAFFSSKSIDRNCQVIKQIGFFIKQFSPPLRTVLKLYYNLEKIFLFLQLDFFLEQIDITWDPRSSFQCNNRNIKIFIMLFYLFLTILTYIMICDSFTIIFQSSLIPLHTNILSQFSYKKNKMLIFIGRMGVDKFCACNISREKKRLHMSIIFRSLSF